MADVDLALFTGWVREFARVIGENAQSSPISTPRSAMPTTGSTWIAA